MPLPYSRRSFLRTSALATCSLGATGCRRLFGQDEIRIAVVGLNDRGMNLSRYFMRLGHPDKPPVEMPKARLVAICDVDSAILMHSAKILQEEFGLTVETYKDYRRLLEKGKIDAVILATPNHWHALQTIWACEAGKDVYVEKPVSHTIWEGRQMVEAARKHRRIVQSGLQSRSDSGLNEAFTRIMSGEIGPIQHIRGLVYRHRSDIGLRTTPLLPPSTVNYEEWLGPAEDLPMYRDEFHYDWHWVWNTGNGDLGNMGSHELDTIRRFLGEPDHPESVYAFGGRFAWDDAGETPNTLMAGYVLKGIPVYFEVRNLWVDPETNAAPTYRRSRVGLIITCEGGQFRGGNGGGRLVDLDGRRIAACHGDGGFDHLPNFLRAIESRKQDSLVCPIEQGFRSSTLAHLGNISYRLGTQISDNQLRARIDGDEWLTDIHQRYLQQLQAWNLKPDQLQWTYGPKLNFQEGTEQFVGEQAAAANAFLRGKARAPYTIPTYS